jgi:hypothetical protein
MEQNTSQLEKIMEKIINTSEVSYRYSLNSSYTAVFLIDSDDDKDYMYVFYVPSHFVGKIYLHHSRTKQFLDNFELLRETGARSIIFEGRRLLCYLVVEEVTHPLIKKAVAQQILRYGYNL